MSRTTTDLLYGITGQTLAHRVLSGRPTSATFSVFEDYADDGTTAEFSGTATVDATTTTVDGASGVSSSDPQKINLTATSAISVGRKYLLSQNSKQEWVEPIEIISADYIRVRHPLRNDYTSGATFVGTTITAAVDSTWVATEANLSDHLDPNPDYRVRWEILIDGATQVAYSYFDLVRATVTHGIDIEDVNVRAPGLHDSLPVEYQPDQGRSLLDSAWRSAQAKCASLKIDTDAFRDDQFIDELTILRTLYMLASGGWHPLGMSSGEYIAETRTDYERFIEQHVQIQLRPPVAQGASSGAAPKQAAPIWGK
ncbi:MAG: hypothetical protein V4703_04170 [Actinomycetota bacterium]